MSKVRAASETDPAATEKQSYFSSDVKDSTDPKGQVAVEFPECDHVAAVNYNPRNHGTFGYLLAWSGPNNLTLKADLSLVNAFNGPGQTYPGLTTDPTCQSLKILKCAGVIESFRFGGKSIDPIYISAWVSKDNAAMLYGSFTGPKPKTNIQLAWYIISCDGFGAGWYEAAYIKGFSNAEAYLDSRPDQREGNLMIAIGHKSTPLTPEIDVRLYNLRFQVVPSPTVTSHLNFASSSGSPTVIDWSGNPAPRRPPG